MREIYFWLKKGLFPWKFQEPEGNRPKKFPSPSKILNIETTPMWIPQLTSLSPQTFGGHLTSKDTIIWSFNYTEQNGYLKILSW